MMKSVLFVIVLLLQFPAFAQEYIADRDGMEVPILMLPKFDNDELVKKELSKRDSPARPPEFAAVCKVDAGCFDKGKWSIDGSSSIWQMEVHSEDAQSLNFGFSEFYLPPSAQFYIIGLNTGIKRGPFVASDNEPHDQFWSPIIEDDKVLLHLEVNTSEKDYVRLHLAKANHGYLKFGSVGFSGACNLDVICSAADGWSVNDERRDIIRSVVMYSINGSLACTGMLINNIREDFTPYIITADHCGVNASNAASIVAYYNYENSFCRQPNSTQSGQNGNGALNTFNSGTIFQSATSVDIGTDFSLVILDDPINPSANAFLSGWNRKDEAPNSAICIHHPNNAEKRISYEDDPLQITENSGISPNPNARYLRVIDWDTGTTEPGSSGSPLFDANGRFIGQLFGGTAACGNNESDYYGRLAISWEGGGSSSTRVKDYLDPDQIELLQIDGIDANNVTFLSPPDAYFKEVCKPNSLAFSISTNNNFNGTVSYSIISNSGSAAVDFQPSTPNPGQEVAVTITNISDISTGLHDLRIKLEDTGGNAIEIPLWYEVRDAMDSDVTLNEPSDGAEYQIPTPILAWSDLNANYDIEVSTDIMFSSTTSQVNNWLDNSWRVDTELSPNTTYYWRVRANTICAVGNWSAVNSFKTGGVPECQTFNSSDVPKTISEPTANVIESTLNISNPGQIASIRIPKIKGQHTWISDLSFTLTSPEGTAVELLSNQCNDEDNFDIGFDDDASTSVVACPYNNGAIYIPQNSLSAFIGELASGKWTLRVSDNADDDGGSLDEWNIELCLVTNPNLGLATSADTIEQCSSVDTAVQITPGLGFGGNVTLSVISNPGNLTTSFSQNNVAPGTAVDLNVSGLITGSVPLVISATDGSVVVNKSLFIRHSPSPDEASLISPSNMADEVPINTTISWLAAENTDTYHYQVANDIDFVTLVSEGSGTSLSANLSLEETTTYFWRVKTINECDTTISKVSSFETGSRFQFYIPEDSITTCQTEITYEIILQSGFIGNVIATLSDEPEGSTLSYENNPGQLMDTIRINLSSLPSLPAQYTMSLNLTDDLGSIDKSLILVVENPPGAPDLLTPMNNEANVDTLPTLTFTLGDRGTNHFLQIATDEAFNNLVATIEDIQGQSVILTEQLEKNTIYYWRLASLNSCGISFSPIFQFMTIIGTSTREIFGATSIQVLPNPADDIAFISIETDQLIKGSFEVYSAGGQQIESGQLKTSRTMLETSTWTKGVYFIKINDDNAFIVKKLIIF